MSLSHFLWFSQRGTKWKVMLVQFVQVDMIITQVKLKSIFIICILTVLSEHQASRMILTLFTSNVRVKTELRYASRLSGFITLRVNSRGKLRCCDIPTATLYVLIKKICPYYILFLNTFCVYKKTHQLINKMKTIVGNIWCTDLETKKIY